MSILSSLIRNNFIKAVEEELIKASPDIKEMIHQELIHFSEQILGLIGKKMESKTTEDEK